MMILQIVIIDSITSSIINRPLQLVDISNLDLTAPGSIYHIYKTTVIIDCCV